MSALLVQAGEQPGELRWIAEPSTFAVLGLVTDFGPVARPMWLAEARVVSHRELVLRVRDGERWSALNDAAWSFVPAAVAQVASWSVTATTDSSTAVAADERLCAAVCGVLEGEFGDYVASHGGSIELIDVHDGVVRVRLAGACSSCSLADWTLKLRLERDVRLAAGPDFAELVTI